jgi:hypothetical protein
MTMTARFVTKHGDVFWGPVTSDAPDQTPRYTKLEQYAGTFEYAHEDHEPVYREVER